MIFQGADERFPRLAKTVAILPVHIVGMELNLNYLPDDAICVSRVWWRGWHCGIAGCGDRS
jgi:hypothetical protein